MIRKSVFALIMLAASAAAAAPFVYVTNERDGTVTVIDTSTDRVAGTFRVGGRLRGLQLSRDGRTLWVAVSRMKGTALDVPEGIVALDTRTGAQRRRYEVGPDPERFVVDAAASRLYVANEDAGTASIIDMRSGRTLATLVVGLEPEGVAISPDGRWVYVTSESSSSVSVIDTRKNEVVASMLVGARPRVAVFSSSGSRAYVTAENGRTISVVDTARHRVISTIHLPPPFKPVTLLLAPGEKVGWVATGRGNSVAMVDLESGKVLRTVVTGQRTWGLAASAGWKKLYAANGLSNDVTVIDVAAGRAVATIRAGNGPWGVAGR